MNTSALKSKICIKSEGEKNNLKKIPSQGMVVATTK